MLNNYDPLESVNAASQVDCGNGLEVRGRYAPDLDEFITINIRYVSDYPDVQKLVGEFRRKIFPKKSSIKLRKQTQTVTRLLCNLWEAYRFNRCLAVSLRKADYALDKRLGQLFYKYDPMDQAVTWLHENGMIELKLGFYDRRKNGQGRRTRIWATATLTSLFDSLERSIFPSLPVTRAPREALIVLKNENKKRIFFAENDFTLAESKKLAAYNALISSKSLNIELASTPSYKDTVSRVKYLLSNLSLSNTPPRYITGYLSDDWLETEREKYSLQRILLNLELIKIPEENHLYRVFNNSSLLFDQGGRFYGPSYQRLPASLRKYLTVNGEATIELDFCALHPAMLYHQRDLVPPIRLYKYEKGDPLRDIAKLVILTAINAPTAEKAIRSLANSVKQDSILKEALLESNFTEINLREQCKAFLSDFLAYHQPISSAIGTGAGVYLQCLDAELASKILWHFTQKGVPVLPVHDSFIVQAQYEEELRAVMQSTYLNKFNYSIGVERS